MASKTNSNWVLVTCILASSLAFVDSSVTNVALPAIGHSFAAGAADLQWVINAYLLPLSALLLLGGAAGDRYGRVRLLVGGTALFPPHRWPAPWPRICPCCWPAAACKDWAPPS
jgi:MFS family permease